MKRNSYSGKIIGNQQGMALVSALLLLLVVTMLALGMSTDTSIDVRVAGYQRFKARAFGFGEAGMMATTDILEDNIHDGGWDQVAPNDPFQYPNLSAAYVPDAAGDDIDILRTTNPDTTPNNSQHGVFYMDENPNEDVVLQMRGDIGADVATQRVVAKLAKGGAVQVAAGYSGMGKGVAAGGGHIIYNLLSTGADSDQARARLGLHYRHVTK